VSHPQTNRQDDAPERTGRKHYRDGTHRTDAPLQTLARVKPHMAAMGITRIANLTGLDRLGIPVVGVFRPNSRSVAVAQGKGLHLDAAKVSGLMEAVETFHAETIHPARIASSEALEREEAVIDISRLPRSPDTELPADAPVPWVRATDWTNGNPLWVPFELVSTDYTLPLPAGTGYFQANTNGLASGNCALEAVLHGVCELIERDATALWWRRTPDAQSARMVDLDSVVDPGCRWVLDRYAAANVKVAVWDTTSDIAVASFLCAAYGEDPPVPELGAGCHPCREIALLRAVTEAAQARTTVISGSRDDLGRRFYTSEEASDRLRQFRGLMDRPRRGVPISAIATFESDTISADMDHVVARLAVAGMREIAVVDLARPEFGIAVVRVLVPGLEGLVEDDYVPGARAQALARAA
jgi:ribosomal protein S12 methylthiotransferase accessory factor